MIKKTIYFGNPAYLSLQNSQLRVELLADDDSGEKAVVKTVPVEDIGVVIFDCPQITTTIQLVQRLVDFNVAIITCSASHIPMALTLALDGNTIQGERYNAQIEASLPLKKQLWQQTIKQKIENQAAVLKLEHGTSPRNMLHWASEVKSGDPDNLEGRAAAFYWANLFSQIPDFRRDRMGMPPNNLLNYGYAILRAVIARSLVASGLLPTLGIHHHNRYNAYCLADDIMEPYRPYVDRVVSGIVHSKHSYDELTKQVKKQLLAIPAIDVTIDGKRSPLMIASQATAASLSKCFEGSARKIIYPVLE